MNKEISLFLQGSFYIKRHLRINLISRRNYGTHSVSVVDVVVVQVARVLRTVHVEHVSVAAVEVIRANPIKKHFHLTAYSLITTTRYF